MIKKFFEGLPLKLFCTILALTVVWGVFQAYFATMLSVIVSSKLATDKFSATILTFVVYITVWECIEYFNEFFLEKLCTHISNNIFITYFQKLCCIWQPPTREEEQNYISGLVIQMVEQKRNAIFKIITALISVVYVGYIIIYVTSYSAWFSIAVLSLICLSIFVLICGRRFTSNDLNLLTLKKAEQTNRFIDGVDNISTIQKFEAGDFICKKMLKLNQDVLLANNRFMGHLQLFLCVYKFLNYMVFPACFFIVFYFGIKKNVRIVEFISYLSIVIVLLSNKVSIISDAIKSTFVWYCSQKKLDLLLKNTRQQTTFFDGTIQQIALKEVKFSYKNSVNIYIPSFVVEKGQFVCIVGESGQGKTTLLNIISGQMEIKDKLLINDTLTNKRLDLVYVSKDTEILNMSLRDNLTFGDEHLKDNDLLKIIEQVGMADWLANQKDGLDTKLGTRGAFVSEGQKQRLNIARGLLKEKDIYLFDEPTSAIDLENRKILINLFFKRLQGKIAIFVTHDELLCRICSKKYLIENHTVLPINTKTGEFSLG